VKKRKTHTFDAPIGDVWAMMIDPAAHIAKAERAGHENVTIVEEQLDETGLLIRMGRDVTIELPGFAKNLMHPRNHVVSTDEWRDRGDGTYGGSFSTQFRSGAPLDLHGTTHMEPAGDDRTSYTVEIELKVKVPMLGKKLERWAGDDVEAQIDNEFAAGDEWLAAKS
jgi:hypothetical protein